MHDNATLGDASRPVALLKRRSITRKPSAGRPRLAVEELEHRTLLAELHVGPAQPFSTIQAAGDVAGPGDSVVVHDGNYAGFQVTRSGTAAAPITFRALGDKAVINSDGPSGHGIFLRNVSYITIEGFHITGVSGSGIAARDASPTNPMHGLIIRGNTVTGVGGALSTVYLSEVADSLFENNKVVNTGPSHALYLANAGSDGTIIRGNDLSGAVDSIFHMNGDASIGGDGIISGLVIENNIIHDGGGNGINMDGVQDSVIRNNIIFGTTRHAIRGYRIDAAAGPLNLTIVNNTGNCGDTAIKLTEGLGGELIFNNLVLGGLDAEIDNAQAAANLNGDPAALFVNAAGGDYHLKAGSPAIDAGLTAFGGTAAPNADFEGTARPQGPSIDVGADELGPGSGGGGGDTTPPTVQNSQLVSSGNKTTGIMVTFSEAMNSTRAQNSLNYEVRLPGRDGQFGTRDDGVIRIRSVAYSAATRTVTLTFKRAMTLRGPLQLKVNGTPPSGLTDLSANLLDGDGDNQAGGNFVTVLRP